MRSPVMMQHTPPPCHETRLIHGSVCWVGVWGEGEDLECQSEFVNKYVFRVALISEQRV